MDGRHVEEVSLVSERLEIVEEAVLRRLEVCF